MTETKNLIEKIRRVRGAIALCTVDELNPPCEVWLVHCKEMACGTRLALGHARLLSFHHRLTQTITGAWFEDAVLIFTQDPTQQEGHYTFLSEWNGLTDDVVVNDPRDLSRLFTTRECADEYYRSIQSGFSSNRDE